MPTFTMTAGNDTITATDSSEVLGANGVGGGTDIIYGGGGDDRFYILQGTEHVTYYGEEGDDELGLLGYIADGTFDGGDGFDVVTVEEETASLGTMSFVNVERITAYTFIASISQLMSVSSIRPYLRDDYDIRLVGEGGNLDLTLPRIETNRVVLLDASALSSGLVTTGGTSNDVFVGSAYADVLSGNRGDDEIKGGDGGDTLNGDAGNDSLHGEAGDDTLNGGEGNDTFYGGSGTDVLNGGSGDDKFVMDETSSGTVDGGDGWDVVSGNALGSVTYTNVEELVSWSGSISIRFADLALFSQVSVDHIWLIGAGGALDLAGKSYFMDGTKLESAITVTAGPEGGWIVGTEFADTFNGGAARDVFTGGDGNDTINGGAGDDILIGHSGDAYGIEFDHGTDVLNGQDGNDHIEGRGRDVMNGGAGDDVLAASDDAKLALTVDGGTGTDWFWFNGDLGTSTFINVEFLQSYRLTASLEQLKAFSTIYRLENLTLSGAGGTLDLSGKLKLTSGISLNGSALTSAVTLAAEDSDDWLVGSRYSDTLRGRGGADQIDGGAGTDVAVYSGKRADYTVAKLPGGFVTITDNRPGANDGQDTLLGVEMARFSDGTLDLRNLAPTSLALSRSTVAEDRKVGTTIGTLSAVDPEGGAITYSLSSNPGGIFKIVGNTLQLAKAIDYETAKSHAITIVATDVGGNSISKSVSIGVINVVDEAPTSLALSKTTVLESSKVGTTIGTLSAIDPEGGAITYSLSSNPGGLFKIVGNVLQLAKAVDYETAKSHAITIVAIDAGGKSTSKNVSIGVTNVNEAPTSLALSKTTVLESSKVGTTIGTLSAIDPEGGAITYSLSSNPGGLFKIVGNVLQLAKAVDYETAKSHAITIVAIDAGGKSTSKNVSIGVTNVNEAPTSIALSKASVTENSKIETIVGTLSATDPEGKAMSYTLTDNAGGLFKIVGNKLVTAKAVDFEKVQTDTVTVQAFDGVNKGTRTFTISVMDQVEAIIGTAKAETLKGGIGADFINAGRGDDRLIGGVGADKLYGGSGADTFSFLALKDSTRSPTGRDVIYDFDGKAGDRIDLSRIDAKLAATANDAFSFIGTDAFSKKAGELRYDKTSSDTYLYGDVNGDGKADFSIHFDDPLVLSKGYFIL
ncbi:cadherin domain-containing protein [Shinella sp. CPCC 101442]|uniref:cadherin domain-containing protein n=1 Tax=Shinella sp. CPCC 101442 TaxID=2932265 RepID=UPI0021532157|nr:cadherin domain-containing protein [Shinella sp. CPCC 101442]MCR6502185.1 cadherin domain-containing protein [Shinella sp. CPCC 101442]